MMPINIVLYRHKRVDDRHHYYKQPHIIEHRHAYFHQTMNNHQENSSVIKVMDLYFSYCYCYCKAFAIIIV